MELAADIAFGVFIVLMSLWVLLPRNLPGA